VSDGARLAAGQFYGHVAARKEVSGLILTQTTYAGAAGFPVHSHDLPYFSYLIAGAHVEHIGRRELDYRPFAPIYHPTGEEHAGRVRAGSQMLVLELGPTWLARLPGLERAPKDGLALHGVATLRLSAALFREFHREDPCAALAVEHLTCELLAAAGAHVARERSRPAWLGRVEELLHAATGGVPDLARVASEVGRHPVYVARVFRRFHGVSMGAYVRGLRLQSACSALTRPDARLSAIATELGFADQSHFTRAFTAAVGASPGRFRAEALGRRRRQPGPHEVQ
jgi:AraC family transcriptional regulator